MRHGGSFRSALLPAAAQCAEDIDLGKGSGTARCDEIGLSPGERAFGVEHGQEVDLPLALAGQADPRGAFGFIPRPRQGFDPFLCTGIGGQGPLGFLKRSEDGAVEGRQ
jgi:hypothetical protein